MSAVHLQRATSEPLVDCETGVRMRSDVNLMLNRDWSMISRAVTSAGLLRIPFISAIRAQHFLREERAKGAGGCWYSS
jgi:hypothetical protein